jgi:hypothetical protein
MASAGALEGPRRTVARGRGGAARRERGRLGFVVNGGDWGVLKFTGAWDGSGEEGFDSMHRGRPFFQPFLFLFLFRILSTTSNLNFKGASSDRPCANTAIPSHPFKKERCSPPDNRPARKGKDRLGRAIFDYFDRIASVHAREATTPSQLP